MICPAGHESATDDYCDVCGAVMMPVAAQAAAPAPTTTAGASAHSGPACANCGAPHDPGDAFCEVCGLDFATGDLPQPPPPPEPAGPEAGPERTEPTEASATTAPERAGAPEAPSEPDPDAAPAAAAEEAEAEARPEAEAEGDAEAPRAPAPPRSPAPGEWYVVVEPDHDWFERNEAEGTAGAVSFPEDTSAWQLTLTGDEVLLGRRSDTRTAQPDLELEDPGVSRRHALLRRQPDGTWTIVDEQSTNGTWVNSAADPIVAGEAVPVADGTILHIGAFTRLTIRRA